MKILEQTTNAHKQEVKLIIKHGLFKVKVNDQTLLKTPDYMKAIIKYENCM
jgi:hypothetical protein